MAITVEELYSKENHKNFKLVAGKEGMSNIVSWIHMVESIQITSFLEGCEIAFTTGVGLKSIKELEGLVESIYAHKASALVLNIGPFISEIPQSVKDFCDDVNLPLFEVPWEVHMANIIRNICMEIIESDRFNMVLNNAVKNAIYYPKQEELYVPSFESYHFMRDWPYCVSVVEINSKDGNDVTEIINRMMKMTENTITRKYKNSIVLEMEQNIVIFMANYSDEEIRNAMTDFNNHIVSLLPDNYECYFGVGECTKNIKCIYKSYNKAKNALKMQKIEGKANKVVFYRELGPYKLLMNIEDKGVINEYYDEVLKSVEIYDNANNTDFLDFLKKYFMCDCSVQDTAERLFMHRNSVRYKLNKINELLGKDLNDLKTKLDVYMALMIKEIL